MSHNSTSASFKAISELNNLSRPPGYKTFFMLNSIEHEFFSLLINVKMPTILGILTFMRRKNSIHGLFESEKKLIFLIFSYL